jgi:hypothetical protein
MFFCYDSLLFTVSLFVCIQSVQSTSADYRLRATYIGSSTPFQLLRAFPLLLPTVCNCSPETIKQRVSDYVLQVLSTHIYS